MFSLPVSESGMSEPAPLGAPATPRGGEAQRRRLQEKTNPKFKATNTAFGGCLEKLRRGGEGVSPKGEKAAEGGKAKLSGKSSAQRARGQPGGGAGSAGSAEGGKRGIPKVAFPARVGKVPRPPPPAWLSLKANWG